MRRSTASELRMLREIVWHIGTIKHCFFCKKLLLDPGAIDLEFGERNCPPVKIPLAIHHRNEDHEDNNPDNRKLAHSSCHKRYHVLKQHAKAGGKRIGAKNA
jgi:hypothetical protein